MNNDNFILIQGWMCNELKLAGNELLVYALIYGFSQDGESWFNGSRRYIAETINVSMPTVDKALKGLLVKGLIAKEEKSYNGMPIIRYQALQGIKNLDRGYKESLQGYKESLYNNTNKKTNNINGYIDDFADGNQDLKSALSDFADMRKRMKKPLTERAVKMILDRLKELSSDTSEQIEIINQSILHNWQSVYPLKQDGSKQSKYVNYSQRTDSYSDLEKILENS